MSNVCFKLITPYIILLQADYAIACHLCNQLNACVPPAVLAALSHDLCLLLCNHWKPDFALGHLLQELLDEQACLFEPHAMMCIPWPYAHMFCSSRCLTCC